MLISPKKKFFNLGCCYSQEQLSPGDFIDTDPVFSCASAIICVSCFADIFWTLLCSSKSLPSTTHLHRASCGNVQGEKED